jgi:putative phosphoribosyl transferase
MVEFTMDTEHPVTIPCDQVHLDGLLHIPQDVLGVVIFAHGSGSSRFSPRNQYSARVFQHSKFATLLFDLLTPEEDEIDTQTTEYRFDIEFLAMRLLSATHWMMDNPVLDKLPMGYFGASTGGGAALVAAAKEQATIKAVVSRGGRPDLADRELIAVKAATLLIVGGNDETVIQLNQQAFEHLHCVKKLEIVPGATHLFEEPGKLAEVSHFANEWFREYLR